MLQAFTALQPPSRKKGKAESTARVMSSSSQSFIHACHEVAQSLLAVAGDVCCILQWSCAAAPAVATFELAHAMMQWASDLSSANLGELKTCACQQLAPAGNMRNNHVLSARLKVFGSMKIILGTSHVQVHAIVTSAQLTSSQGNLYTHP